MNFFLQIHRSIVDPSFCEEVLSYSRVKVISFFLKLLVGSIIVITVMHTIKIYDSESGLPAVIPALFPSMEITKHGLKSFVETPYVPNSLYIADFFSLLSNRSISPQEISDSFIVVDTKNSITITDKSSIRLLFSSDVLFINFVPFISANIPYTAFIREGEKVVSTSEGVKDFLRHKLLTILLNLFLQHCVTVTIKYAITLIFLGITIFIFNTRRYKGNISLYRLSFFALTPIALESILIALSGVINDNVWYFSLFISMIVLFRAINYLNNVYGRNGSGDN